MPGALGREGTDRDDKSYAATGGRGECGWVLEVHGSKRTIDEITSALAGCVKAGPLIWIKRRTPP